MSERTKDQPQVHVVQAKSVTYTPYDSRWIPRSARLVAVGGHPRGTGAVHVYELEPSRSLAVRLEAATSSAIKACTLAASRRGDAGKVLLAAGDFSGKVSVLDLERDATPAWSVPGAHRGIVNAVDGAGGDVAGGPGAPEIATGGRDGCVRVWDPRTNRAVAELTPGAAASGDCWAVAFGSCHAAEERVVAAAWDTGDVALWDLRAGAVSFRARAPTGVCGLAFDRKDIAPNKLMSAGLGAKLCCWDLRAKDSAAGFARAEQSATLGASGATAWCVRPLPQDRDLFAVSCGNGSLGMWRYSYPEQRVRTTPDGKEEGVPGELLRLAEGADVASQPIVSVDWNPDMLGLGTLAVLDQTVKVVAVTKLHKIH
eukprot:m51a1_g4628 hypothetical protein (370) ;mRNA; r:318740-319849